MSDRTIEQFGEQWDRFSDTGGYFGSVQLLQDFCGPLLPVGDIAGRRVVEIGSGNGRFVRMLIEAGASRVTAVEPSTGIEVLKENTRAFADRIDYVQSRGEDIPDLDVDLAFCIGVLHHLQDPLPTARRVFEVLKPGGAFVFWVYGRENNAAYIAFAETLRRFTRVVPDFVLSALGHVLNLCLGVYVLLCRHLPLPLHRYMREVMSRLDWRKRYFLIFDQLNCGYARYYTESEARDLMARAGFERIELYHRHEMSWTAIGRKAKDQAC